MPDTHTTSVDQQRLEKERIEDDGTVTLTRGGHAIHCLTVIEIGRASCRERV